MINYRRLRAPAGHWLVAARSESGVLAIEFESKPADDTDTTIDGTVATADGGVATGWSFPAGSENYASASQQWHGIPIGLRRDVLPMAGDRWNPPAGYDGRDHRSVADATCCPYWLICAPLTLAMAVTCRRARRWWSRPDRCPQCGYHRRASPDRCPEWGAV